MKYDDASWHYGGDFPKGSPDEYGATHIAMFLKWCFRKGWAGEFHLEECPDDVARMISGDLRATDYFLRVCDGKLTDEDLSDEGNAFAEKYYGKKGHYLNDYSNAFEALVYKAPEEKHDYLKFEEMIEARIKSGELQSADDK